MTKKLTRPSWYDEEFYNKVRTPEEWLYEIWKRNQFKQGKISLHFSVNSLPITEQEQYFIEFIFEKECEKFLSILLKATPPQPIKYPSISDVFFMYHLIKNSDWYNNHSKRGTFESAIPAIIKRDTETLSREQKAAFLEMHETPWCVFHELHTQETWCPIKEMGYLSGIPLSLDPGYIKEDTITVLKKKLNAWVGKLQDIRLQFDRWQEGKILAVFDLMLWFKIRKTEYSNKGLHNLIWPNGRISKSTGEEVNPYDDIDHSIALASRVIDDSPVSSLLSLCNTRKFKKENADA
jgi:hypothetical protein